MTIDELKQFLSNMTVIEACRLTRDLEEAWGAKPPHRVWVPNIRMMAGYGAPPPRVEADMKRYYLTDAGANPVYTMKILRQHLNLDLTQIKAALHQPEFLLLETDNPEAVRDMLKDLEAAGAKVSLK